MKDNNNNNKDNILKILHKPDVKKLLKNPLMLRIIIQISNKIKNVKFINSYDIYKIFM